MISAGIPNETRKEVYRRDGYRCALCDSTKYLQIHHYVPRSHAGNDTPHNLITLCMVCHSLAHGNDLIGCGITKDEAEQSICEYLADFYADEWWPYK